MKSINEKVHSKENYLRNGIKHKINGQKIALLQPLKNLL